MMEIECHSLCLLEKQKQAVAGLYPGRRPSVMLMMVDPSKQHGGAGRPMNVSPAAAASDDNKVYMISFQLCDAVSCRMLIFC